MARTGLQKGIKKADTSQYPFLIFFIGRSDWVRTSDLYVPNVALYQAELHSDYCALIMRPFDIKINVIFCFFYLFFGICALYLFCTKKGKRCFLSGS